MDTDSRQPVSGSRLRLVDVRLVGERGHLKFGRHLSGVLTGTHNRGEAAQWIAATVVGPRPPDTGGSIEVDGSVVSVWSLPSPLLPPSAPTVIDGRVIRAQWARLCRQTREELAAAHATCRLDSYRIDAAFDQARERMWPTLAPTANGAAATPPPAVDWATPPDETTRIRAKLHGLVGAYEALEPERLPEGLLLADAWDAHTMLVHVREAAEALPADENIEALEVRVNAARAAAAMGAGGVPDDLRLRIEQCHRSVVDAEGALLGAKRKRRQAAMAGYEGAVAAELVALADAGIDSYASFLGSITSGGVSADEGARRAAEDELVSARAALDAARQVPAVPTRVELQERETLMRTRATELLGRAPGADPAEELRALRLEPEIRDRALAAIAEVLRDEGIEPSPDVMTSARAFLAVDAPIERPSETVSPPSAAPANARRPRSVPSKVVDPEVSREVADLEEERWALDRQLARLEAQIALVDEVTASGGARLGPEDFVRALECVIEAYRFGDLLAGRLPLVLDGLLDGLAAATRAAAVEVFAIAEDVQTVVVTHDPEVMQSLARAGGTLARWPEQGGTA